MTGVSDIQEAVAQIKAAGPSKPRLARDPVNQPMINNWVEAIGDRNPIYVDDAAARAAGHPGNRRATGHDSGVDHDGSGRSASEGRSAGTHHQAVRRRRLHRCGCHQLRADLPPLPIAREQVSISAELGDVVGPKQTALGEGWFINQHIVWQVGDEDVAEMNWRILKFKPAGSPSSVPDDLDPDAMMRPSSSRDTAFFWDGVKAHELRIQRLADGSLRHPPVPAVWQDKSVPINYVVSSGRGTVFSFVVHHAPKVPGRTVPFVIALVELEEGVRMLGELRGADPARVAIGMPVRATYIDFPDWSLYAWEPDE